MLSIFDNGYFTTVTGGGSLFQNFVRNKTLGYYTGKYHCVTPPNDPGYRTARLRHLPFDRCFSFSDEDVHQRKYNFNTLDT